MHSLKKDFYEKWSCVDDDELLQVMTNFIDNYNLHA
jgi:hypothetical protein